MAKTDYQRIFRSVPGLVLLLRPDPGFTIIDASDAYLQATRTGRENITGRGFFEVFPGHPEPAHETAASTFRASLERVLATRSVDTVVAQQYDIRRQDSEDGAFEEKYWTSVNAPVLSEQGEILYVVRRIEDVTELVRVSRREQVERAQLAEANNRFQAIYDQGLYAGWLDLDGKVIDANRSSLEQCGLVREDVIGKPFWECGWWNRSADVQSWLQAGVRRAIAGEAFRGESIYFWADGTERVVDFACMPIADEAGKILFVLATGMDITERAEAEQARLAVESEKQRRIFEAALSSTPDLVYVFDLDHRFTYANEALLRMWGRSSEDALGKNCLELGYEQWHAEMHDREIDQVVATRQPIRGEVPFTGTAGTRIYDYIFVPVIGPDGNVVAIAGNTRDITERQRAEQAIREQAARLSAADRAKDEFLATLAHELRNPLAPLRNSLSLLRMARNGDAVTGPIHEMMERQVNHLVRLVDDLLEMSRISRGALTLRKERIEVQAIVRNALETSAPLINAAGHRLSVSLPEEDLWLEGDPVRLAQILANLLNNAAKYTGANGQIFVEVQAEEHAVAISVLDNGPGIAADALTRIFDMFSRGEDAIGRDGGGLGIGLALARRLAEMHGGTLTARSEGDGHGSEFIIRLPLAGTATTQAAAETLEHAAIPRKRILLVDDNRDAADSLGMILEFLGAEVRIARDGSEALAALQDFDPSVVLLDIGMPGMNGYEVARTIRARFPGQRPALVALTGWGQDDDRRRAREAGFDHHLIKPAEIGVLQALLTSLHENALQA